MNNTVTDFDAQQITILRQKASSSWMDQLSEDLELNEGWSISSLDLQAFVSVFAPPLQLKSGLILRAYQFFTGRDGETRVWAMPENLPFPEPYLDLDNDEDDYDDDYEPPQPTNSLNNIMEAIEGDFSPWSYLCASILAREISEIGAFGHGSYWISFIILDQAPWVDPDLVDQLTNSIDEWEWFEEKPSNWKPFVSREDKKIIVQFYTYSGLGNQEITRHIDVYTPNSYVFESSTQKIASHSSGYVW